LPEMQEYLNNSIILVPADFPGQLNIRKAIVQRLVLRNLTIPKEITHLVPFLGALHLSLNTHESVFLVFWTHAGWQIIKEYVIVRFGLSKDIGYRTFFDLLDNLIPATLDIYTILFRGNHFDEYVSTVFRLWSVMKRFNWHNYDKILLAFISDIHYWKMTGHSIIDTLKNHLNIFDEYPVENFHSLLRHHTNAKVNTAKSLRRDALFIDNLRHNNDFITSFASKRDYPYTKKDLDELVKATAIFLLDFFENVWKYQGKMEKKVEGKIIKKVYCYFPYIECRFPLGALLLGYHSQTIPSQHNFCDRINCFEIVDNRINVLICGHAYHEKCFQLQGLRCKHCFLYLSKAIDDLADSYNQRL
ncbi:7115_t:CDS:2, partial [Gigaspora rosea]